jgi:hypothetical protein
MGWIRAKDVQSVVGKSGILLPCVTSRMDSSAIPHRAVIGAGNTGAEKSIYHLDREGAVIFKIPR